MDISVIIPTYNRSKTISRAISSVLEQTSPANEIIVVDDGSSDNTLELIQQQFPHVHIIQQGNQGVSSARNTGIKQAQHDWIAFLDSDDEWLPEKLKTIRMAEQHNPQEVLFHSNEIWIRNGTRVNQMNKHAKQGGMIFKNCLPLCVISPSASIINKSIFEKIGFFDEKLPACEDYDLWLRLCHQYKVFYINKPLIKKYGGHEDQLSRKFWGMDRFRIRSLHALMQLTSLDKNQQQLTISMLNKKLRILLKGAKKHNNQEILDEFTPLATYYEKLSC